MRTLFHILFNMMALLSAIILNSCVSTRYDINQNMPPKETCAFVLDTIQINNPTIIEYDNIRYVINTTNVDSIPQKDIGTYLDSTFHFILGDNIYYDLPDILYNKVISYSNDVDCGYGIKSKRKNYNILYFKKQPKFFILVALNTAYYNKKHSSIDALQFIRSYAPLNAYILIIYPVCD